MAVSVQRTYNQLKFETNIPNIQVQHYLWKEARKSAISYSSRGEWSLDETSHMNLVKEVTFNTC